ncbi:MAG TPA: alpha/beta fold hydrolase [Burkholderiaceae bacterium]|nr:alpha/beta fold hydrolase [Burkholderiaceae bacterium]
MDISVHARLAPPRVPPAGSRERGASPWLGRGAPPSESFQRYLELERSIAAAMLPMGGGIAPMTIAAAFNDWSAHLATSAAKQWELQEFLLTQCRRAILFMLTGNDGSVEPLPQDKRFDDEHWHRPPYSWLAQNLLLAQQWWQRATINVPGVTRHHEEMVSFGARQWLDMLSPSNFISLNPVVRERTWREAGLNLVRGMRHAFEDAWREVLDIPPAGAEVFTPGINVAITPGRVVLRNRLIELIQYTPATEKVHPEPVLLVPAWIMKYYILDLSPHNSLIKHLVDHGFTVFTISWKNPDADDRDIGMEDYYRLGVRESLDAIAKIVNHTRTHSVGYCLGGTLLSMAAAALGRERSHALATVTLLCAQTDFTEPGELSLFVDESQVSHLEDQMWRKGYLDKHQMRDTFRMIRSSDLIWSYRLLNYLLGERQPVNDLMAWNADGTRMPFRMHSQYLRLLFLENALARGQMELEGVPINLADIRAPIFNVGTVQDHVAPWRSVYRLSHLTDVDQTFVLAAGGHNVGIVNPPGQPRASYRIRHWRMGERLLTPEEWMADAHSVQGSWWTAWVEWLRRHSSGHTQLPQMGAPEAGLPLLEAAPGTYVHQR